MRRETRIIQQQAEYSDRVIFWFDDFAGPNQYGFLSNFYQGEPIEEPGYGYRWMTGEHMFQGYKAARSADLRRVMQAPDPNEAKALGRSIQLRSDWEAVKYDVMRWVLALKFTLEREEGRLLLDTGNRLLVEGTFWGDRVWGVALPPTPGDRLPWQEAGRNWLGHLLMARRAELRSEFGYQVQVDHHTVANFARMGRNG